MNIIPLLFGNLGLAEILIIALVVLLFFGGRKIPELMRGLGKGVSSFKQGMNEIQDEITKPTEKKSDGDGDR
ncbi:MAG: twin-arginine translocase TatA/TatE family subunit [Muribaculum sp.]